MAARGTELRLSGERRPAAADLPADVARLTALLAHSAELRRRSTDALARLVAALAEAALARHGVLPAPPPAPRAA